MNIERGFFVKEVEWVDRFVDSLSALPAKEIKSPLFVQILSIFFVTKYLSANLESLILVVKNLMLSYFSF